jgi:hypothetical protein
MSTAAMAPWLHAQPTVIRLQQVKAEEMKEHLSKKTAKPKDSCCEYANCNFVGTKATLGNHRRNCSGDDHMANAPHRHDDGWEFTICTPRMFNVTLKITPASLDSAEADAQLKHAITQLPVPASTNFKVVASRMMAAAVARAHADDEPHTMTVIQKYFGATEKKVGEKKLAVPPGVLWNDHAEQKPQRYLRAVSSAHDGSAVVVRFTVMDESAALALAKVI